MKKNLSDKDNAHFLKNEYGTGGRSPAYGVIDEEHDSHGLTLTREREIVSNLSWKTNAATTGKAERTARAR